MDDRGREGHSRGEGGGVFKTAVETRLGVWGLPHGLKIRSELDIHLVFLSFGREDFFKVQLNSTSHLAQFPALSVLFGVLIIFGGPVLPSGTQPKQGIVPKSQCNQQPHTCDFPISSLSQWVTILTIYLEGRRKREKHVLICIALTHLMF